MNGTNLLIDVIKKKYPDSTVTVKIVDGKYYVDVKAASLDNKSSVERQQAVYETFDKVPLTLLAKIVSIKVDKTV